MRKKLNSVILLGIMISVMLLPACNKAGESNNKKTNYKYSDYQFSNTEPQYYMSKICAAAEDGYYYVSTPPIYEVRVDENHSQITERYLYYFDMENMNSFPLCSKSNCQHNSEECEAYLSSEECVGSTIWYYKERIYMMEKTAEKDLLVSYDKTFRDKKTELVLSVDGLSVNENSSGLKQAVLGNGYFYYLMYNDKGGALYKVSLTDGSKPVKIKQLIDYTGYSSDYIATDLITLTTISDKLYVSRKSSYSVGEYDYELYVYSESEDKIEKVINYKDTNVSQQLKISWEKNLFDENNKMYTQISEAGEVFIYKIDLDTHEYEKIYTIEAAYADMCSFDGKYIYIKDTSNQVVKKQVDIHVVDTSGTEVDVLKFMSEKKSSPNITVLGGDSRYLMITDTCGFTSGLMASESVLKKYDALVKNNKIPNIIVIGILDKEQIGKENKDWKNITSE